MRFTAFVCFVWALCFPSVWGLGLPEVVADRGLWPRTVTVNVEVEAPVVVDGREAGKVRFPPGREYPVIAVSEAVVTVNANGSSLAVSPESTDLLVRSDAIQQARLARASATPAPTPTPATPKPTPTPPPVTNKIGEQLAGMLVVADGRKVKPFTGDLSRKKFIAVYSSAHWCPPCRVFTPEFVKWYKRNKSREELFDVVLLSSDRSEEDMEKYMTGDKMPWPAVAYDKRDRSPLSGVSSGGIPGLVVLDGDGKVLARTYVDGKYIGPQKVLDELDKLLRAAPDS